jgi:hypothetical protein
MVERAKYIGFRIPAVIAILIVLPFITFEWTTRSDLPRSNFSPLMVLSMWLYAAVSVQLLMRVVRTVRAGNMTIPNLGFLLLQVALVGFIAWSWVALVVDQMPCFLGATGC